MEDFISELSRNTTNKFDQLEERFEYIIKTLKKDQSEFQKELRALSATVSENQNEFKKEIEGSVEENLNSIYDSNKNRFDELSYQNNSLKVSMIVSESTIRSYLNKSEMHIKNEIALLRNDLGLKPRLV